MKATLGSLFEKRKKLEEENAQKTGSLQGERVFLPTGNAQGKTYNDPWQYIMETRFPQQNQNGAVVPSVPTNPVVPEVNIPTGNTETQKPAGNGNIIDQVIGNIISGTTPTTPVVPNTGAGYAPYVESDEVRAAKAALEAQQKPGQYQSAWQDSIDETLDKILNREEFSYDLNGDALYQQYKDQYVNQGRQAMMDAIGKASALTGGYGNSWAQSAGQQTFQGYLQGLNDRIPELYQLAMDRYNMTGDQLREQLGLLMNREESEYGRYRDALGDYLTERGYLTDRYDTERNYDYTKYADDRDFNYITERDKVADEQWQKEFDEAIRQFLAANPDARAYYATYGNTGSTGTSGMIPGISTGNPYLDYMLGFGSLGSSSVSSSGSSSGSHRHGSSSGSSKTDSDVVDEIIRGEWGNGEARKEALRKAGYSEEEIKALQAEVNKRFDGGSPYGDDDTVDENHEKTDTEKFQDYNDYSEKIIALKKSGASDAEIRSALFIALNKGEITIETYEDLKNNFTGGLNGANSR